jgi:hypothetical protein
LAASIPEPAQDLLAAVAVTNRVIPYLASQHKLDLGQCCTFHAHHLNRTTRRILAQSYPEFLEASVAKAFDTPLDQAKRLQIAEYKNTPCSRDKSSHQ